MENKTGKCGYCGAGPFKTEAGLRMHRLRVHNAKFKAAHEASTNGKIADIKKPIPVVLNEAAAIGGITSEQAILDQHVARVAGICEGVIMAKASELGLPEAVVAAGVGSILLTKARRPVHRVASGLPSLQRSAA